MVVTLHQMMKYLVNAAHTFFDPLNGTDFQKMIVVKWAECMKQCIRLRRQYFEKASTSANERDTDVSDL